jgi:hypothetical protein
LNVGHVDLPKQIIVVRNSRFGKHITPNKSRKPRAFSISPQLALALMPLMSARQADAPLFLSRRGKRLSPDNFVKRELKPILYKLGLDGALHAFWHGNATALDHMNAPLKVRQQRLGTWRRIQRWATRTWSARTIGWCQRSWAKFCALMCPSWKRNGWTRTRAVVRGKRLNNLLLTRARLAVLLANRNPSLRHF